MSLLPSPLPAASEHALQPTQRLDDLDVLIRGWLHGRSPHTGPRPRYQRPRLGRIKYQMHCGRRRTLRAALPRLGWSGKLQTAVVERLGPTEQQARRDA